MPIGTPVTIASPTRDADDRECSSVIWPISGRFATMKARVSNLSPALAGARFVIFVFVLLR